MRRVLIALVAVVALVGVGLGARVVLGGDDDGSGAPAAPAPSSSPTGTPLADVDTLTLTVPREDFCPLVPEDAVARALGRAPAEEDSYADGDRARIRPGVRDVAHEFGCSWRVGPMKARAWLFAPPVTRGDARDLVAEAGKEEGCRTLGDAERFGRPSVAVVCLRKGRREVSYRGLFGDAWLSCSVAGKVDKQTALDRADGWCASVALAASGTAG